MKYFSLYAMIAFYIFAGINHFWHPVPYRKIIPGWFTNSELLVIISGVCEILFALLLIPSATRVFGAWAIIALLIAIFPANVQMMLNFYHKSKPGLLLSILRLPVQFLLIFWAYGFTKRAAS